jgi:ABC-2 type transport system permease protein
VTTFEAALRYEFRMQLRKRSVWLVPAVSVLLFLLLGGSLLRDLFDAVEARTAGKAAMIDLGIQLNALLPIGFGCLLADRLIRDDRLRVAPVLDATPARSAPRLLGKYLGAAGATAMPIVAIYAALAVAYTIYQGELGALGWAAATFGLVMVPGLLFVAAFALTVPLVLDHYGGDGGMALSGPVPGAMLNFLRPEPTALAGWLSIAVLLAFAAAVLAGGQALRTRRTR